MSGKPANYGDWWRMRREERLGYGPAKQEPIGWQWIDDTGRTLEGWYAMGGHYEPVYQGTAKGLSLSDYRTS